MTVIEPPIVVLPPIALALDALATCVCELLASEGAGPTCWCGLYPGASVSWEYCGECTSGACGMGYVRMGGVFPYATFPLPVIDDRCVKPLAWAVEVGALRCLTIPADGEIASPMEMAEATINQMLDATALYKAIKCCGLELAVEAYRPLGPEGGCVGGAWIGYVAVN
jgi:hypothetical protein